MLRKWHLSKLCFGVLVGVWYGKRCVLKMVHIVKGMWISMWKMWITFGGERKVEKERGENWGSVEEDPLRPLAAGDGHALRQIPLELARTN